MDIQKVKELREKTNISLNACKKALEESDGDIEEAEVILQKRGELKANEKSSRAAHEGRVCSYIHSGRIGVLLEVNCETDFAANSAEFKAFCDGMCMQIVAMNPEFISEMSEEYINKQREIFEAQVGDRPEDIKNKIVDGKFAKLNKEVCLLKQISITDSNKTVDQVRTELISKIGENVQIKRFVRWEVGT